MYAIVMRRMSCQKLKGYAQRERELFPSRKDFQLRMFRNENFKI